MTEKLEKLLAAAKKHPLTPEEKEEQRRSFAYGNAKIENARITKQMVADEAELLKRGK